MAAYDLAAWCATKRRGGCDGASAAVCFGLTVRHLSPALIMTALLASLLTACGGGTGEDTGASGVSAAGAEDFLRSIALTSDDAGPGFAREIARVHTNEQAAQARADTRNALRQYAAWGQVLAYNVQYGAPAGPELVFSGRTARIMSTVTLYESPEGAAEALDYARGLQTAIVEGFVTNDGAGARLDDIQVEQGMAFPAKGEESFAWRLSGVARFEDGFSVSFIADAVFLRAGRVTGNVVTVALGSAPDARELESLVDRLVEKIGAAVA